MRSRDRGDEDIPLWEASSRALIAVLLVILFFVRVNQVLVRLWTRAMGVEPCSMTVPLFRLMSDRESRVLLRSRMMGAPMSDGERSETSCEGSIGFALLKECDRNGTRVVCVEIQDQEIQSSM